MRVWTSLCVLLIVGGAAAGAMAGPTSVIVLRHAEKLADDPDPQLSPAGRIRAEALVSMLEDAEIRRIFSTDYRRTRETVEPLARALGLEVEIYDPGDLPGLVRRLAESGEPSLVVGHSNTTTAVVELLGGAPGPPIEDATEFDRLYVLQTDFSGNAGTVLLRYGDR